MQLREVVEGRCRGRRRARVSSNGSIRIARSKSCGRTARARVRGEWDIDVAEAQARKEWSERQGDLVSDSSGGVLVNDRSFRIRRKYQRLTRIPHRQRQGASFAVIEPAEVNGHEKGRSLIVRDAGRGVVSDDTLNEGEDVFVGERVPIALRFNGLEERRHVRWLASGCARINWQIDAGIPGGATVL